MGHFAPDNSLVFHRLRRGPFWQDRSDNPFADREPALSALMQASIRGQLFDPPEVPPRNTGTNAQERALPKRASRNCASSGGYSLHVAGAKNPPKSGENRTPSHNRRSNYFAARAAAFACRSSFASLRRYESATNFTISA